MPYLLIRHNVQDFGTWKKVFDEHGAARQAAGSKGGYLFQSADDPNEVIAVFEWESLDKARQFVQSADLRQAMEKAGVVSEPHIHFLEAADRPSV